MWDKPAITEHDGTADGVQIDLSLGVAYALAGVPMDELTNRVVEVGDFGTIDVDRLLNRLLETPSCWSRRRSSAQPCELARVCRPR